MTRLGIVMLVGFVVSFVSLSTFASCLEPTKLKGAATCVATIKSRINELPPTFVDFMAPLLKAADALENASQEFDADPQDLQQVHDDLMEAGETIDGLNDPLLPFLEQILNDLKNDISALKTDTPDLPLQKRIKNQILRTLDGLTSLAERAEVSVTKLKADLLRSGNGVLDAIDAALTALSLDEEDDARDALALAVKKLDVVINDTNRILRKIVSAMYKSVSKLGKILKISTTTTKLSNTPVSASIASLDSQAFTLQGAFAQNELANGLYLVVITQDGHRTLTKRIVLK
jgi:hypothetical protein